MNGRTKKKSKRVLTAKGEPLRCSVRLEAPATGVERPNPDWIQIAAEGEYRGHPTGPFRLDAEVFGVIVRNFRNHPSYVPMPSPLDVAAGKADVIAFDFSHASEIDPSEIAVEGAPAQAWAIELDVRQGPDGAELWALTRFLPRMIVYRAEGSYKWTSVCIWPDQIDPVSGARIGWYLSSIAFTNAPFIQGMNAIAASRGFDPYCAPTTPEEVLESLRELFEIPALASADEVIASLAKLKAYAMTPGSAPAGVEVEEMVGTLRRIFNLPTLSSVDAVFAEAEALLVALAEALPVSTIAAARKDPDLMDHYKTACLLLAQRLRVKLPEKEDAVPAFLCEAVDAAESEAKKPGGTALEHLTAMFKALGVQDIEAALGRITSTIQDAAELKRVLPQLAELEEVKKKKDEEAIDEDVDVAMTFHGITAEAARPGLLELRRIAPEAFEKRYPKPTKEQLELAKKKTPVHAQRGGSGKTKETGPIPKLPDGVMPTKEMFDEAPGANPSAKGVALVKAHLGDKKLSHEAACELGFKLARALHTDPAPTHANAL